MQTTAILSVRTNMLVDTLMGNRDHLGTSQPIGNLLGAPLMPQFTFDQPTAATRPFEWTTHLGTSLMSTMLAEWAPKVTASKHGWTGAAAAAGKEPAHRSEPPLLQEPGMHGPVRRFRRPSRGSSSSSSDFLLKPAAPPQAHIFSD